MVHIYKENAEAIVSELSQLIDLKLNVVGSDGVILANSDPERVGTYHEAAHNIILRGLDEVVVHSNEQYKGAKIGTNLPIVVNGEIVGVVGVTGAYETARAYSKIIQKMTQILLQSQESENKRRKKQEDTADFYNAWICDNETIINDTFVAHAKTLDVDITHHRRVMVIRPVSQTTEFARKQASLYFSMLSFDPIIFSSARTVIVLLRKLDSAKLLAQAQELSSYLTEQGIDAYIGTDDDALHFTQIHQQYLEAHGAANLGLRLQGAKVIACRKFMLEFMLNEIAFESKQRYLSRLFGDYSIADIHHDMRYISVLYQENGSIKHAAARLMIHPNTLQYQLKKIESRTGFDPRRLDCVALFQAAALFLSDEQDYGFQ
ncbi:MAG: sugar diacid recognition domain-containing protein [Faecalibacterium sp.]